jgi:tetratricopeptide (TPR) repeat protein
MPFARSTIIALLLLLIGSLVHARTAAAGPSTDARARFDEAMRLAQADQLGESMQITYTLLQEVPDYVEAHRLYIDLLAAQGRAEDALHFYRLALEAAPDDPIAHYLYGRATNDPQAALGEFTHAIELDPDFAWAHHGLGAARAMIGDVDAAIASFERAIELQPDMAEAHSHLANLYLSLEREDEAVAAYRRAIEVAPASGDAYFYLGAWMAHHERHDEALELLEEAVRLDGANPMIHLELGSLYVALHREQDAIAAFAEGLRVSPRDEFLRDLHAVAVVVAGGGAPHETFDQFRGGLEALAFNPAVALAGFDEVLTLAPDFHLAHLNRGIALAAVARNEEAEAAIRRAIDFDARYAESHASLAVVLLSQERIEEAEASLQQALALDPAHVEALRGMGMVYVMQARPDLAASYYLRASKLTPLDLALKVELAGAHVQAGDLEAAEEVLRDVLRADPTFNFARHQLAALLTELERYDEAIAELEELRRHVAPEVDVASLIAEVSARRRMAARGDVPGVRLSQILVKDADLAAQLVELARSGQDFSGLARAHSIGSTASEGGDIGELNPMDMQPLMAAAIENLAVGEVTDVIDLGGAYMILSRTH